MNEAEKGVLRRYLAEIIEAIVSTDYDDAKNSIADCANAFDLTVEGIDDTDDEDTA